jgi:uncharacterized protein (TIGR02145 family)
MSVSRAAGLPGIGGFGSWIRYRGENVGTSENRHCKANARLEARQKEQGQSKGRSEDDERKSKGKDGRPTGGMYGRDFGVPPNNAQLPLPDDGAIEYFQALTTDLRNLLPLQAILMRPSLRNTVLALVGFAFAIGVLVACQSTGSSEPESKGPMVAYATFRITSRDSSRIPDSLDWAAGKQAGKGRFVCVDFTCTDTLALSDALGSDTARLRLYKLGLYIATFAYVQTGRAPILTLTSMSSRNDANLALLTAFFEFRKSKIDSFVNRGDPKPAQLVAYYATLVFTKTAGYTGFPDSIPLGMNADSVRKNLVRLAASSKMSWTQLAALKWGLDSVAIHSISHQLLEVGILAPADTLVLFPLPPVRVLLPLSIVGPVATGGPAIAISGAFAWDKGLSLRPAFAVYTASGIDSIHFQLPLQSFLPSDTGWSLAGNLAIQAAGDAPIGTDTLAITLQDDRGHRLVARLPFTVVAGDEMGPVVRFTSPAKDDSVANSSASFRLVAEASDSSGVDSIRIGIHTFAGSRCTLEVDLAVGENVFIATAWDRYRNLASATRRIVRRKSSGDTINPSIIRVAPSADTTIVLWNVKSLTASWAVTDDSLLSKVVLWGTSLSETTLTGTNGAYSWTFSLPVGKDTFYLKAFDAHGNSRTDTVRITRLEDATKPTVARGTGVQDTTLIDSQSAFAPTWTVSDNALKSVWINDTAAASVSGIHSRVVALSGDSLWIKLVATDSSNNETRDSIKVRRLSPPTINPAGAILSSTQTSAFTLAANLPGAALEYSYDTTIGWNSHSKGTSHPITASKLVFARALLGGTISATSKAVFLYSPTFTPGAGSYTEAQSVQISALGGPSIQSKLGSRDWATSTGSTLVLVSSCGKLYARSVLGGVVTNTDSATYVFAPIFDKPTATIYVESVAVAISSTGADSIEYRTDPTSGWTRGASVVLKANTTLYARSWYGGVASGASSASYKVKNDTSLVSLQVTDDKGGILNASIAGSTVTIDSLHGHTKSATVKAIPSDATNATVTINGGTTGTVVLSSDTARISIVVSNNGYSLAYSFLLVASRKDTITDARDKQSYKVVKIGDQWWMAQNLNYRSELGETVDTVGSCYNNEVDSCAKYGRLYNWVDAMYIASSYDTTLLNPVPLVRGICPKGWHVPTDSEWMVLVKSRHASTLATTLPWGESIYGTDNYGFNALPAGIFTGTEFRYLGKNAWWWSMSEYSATHAWMRRLDPEEGTVVQSTSAKTNGFSLRCIEN